MASLDGYSVLLVGASGGLGRRLAALLAERGATLVTSARRPEGLAGLPGTAVPADLVEPGAASELVATAVAATGSLDAVIYAAGAVAFAPTTGTGDDVLETLWQTNTAAAIRLVGAAQPALAHSATEGRSPFVLVFSGVVSEAPTVGLGAYSAAKSALAAWAQVASRELRRSGIRVLDARPGHTETGLALHPIAGTAPALPLGYDPDAVALRIVQAIENDERDLPSTAFAELPKAAAPAS